MPPSNHPMIQLLYMGEKGVTSMPVTASMLPPLRDYNIHTPNRNARVPPEPGDGSTSFPTELPEVRPCPDSPVLPPPEPLIRTRSVNSAAIRIHWSVSGTKLKSNDRQIVSPTFELNFGEHSPVPFKLLIFPEVSGTGKGCAGFKKAKGHGFIKIKCEKDLSSIQNASVKFRISVGKGLPRGPVERDFGKNNTHGLGKEEEMWDLNQGVESGSLLICLEVVPAGCSMPPPQVPTNTYTTTSGVSAGGASGGGASGTVSITRCWADETDNQ